MIRSERMCRILSPAILFMAVVAGGCISLTQKCSHGVADRLVVAWQAQDNSASPLIRQVLEDSLAKNYCYDMTTRADAFDLVDSLRLVDLAPLLREVAAMDYKRQRDFQQTWDLISIERALSALTEFRDPAAEQLNQKRLHSDTWLQVSVVENLQNLEAWDATAEVASLLGSQPDAEHLLLISKVVTFLFQSPETTSDICSRLTTVAEAYGYCFTEADSAGQCVKFVLSMRALDVKLGCGLTPLTQPASLTSTAMPRMPWRSVY